MVRLMVELEESRRGEMSYTPQPWASPGRQELSCSAGEPLQRVSGHTPVCSAFTKPPTSISLLSLPSSPPPSTPIPVFPHSRHVVLEESRIYHMFNCRWHHLSSGFLDSHCWHINLFPNGNKHNPYNGPEIFHVIACQLCFGFIFRCNNWTLSSDV